MYRIYTPYVYNNRITPNTDYFNFNGQVYAPPVLFPQQNYIDNQAQSVNQLLRDALLEVFKHSNNKLCEIAAKAIAVREAKNPIDFLYKSYELLEAIYH